MLYIALFFPALISVGIYNKRHKKNLIDISTVSHYAGYVLIENIIVMYFTYRVFPYEPTVEDFERLGFVSKFLLLGMIVSILLPYLEEIASKYISISFSVRSKPDVPKDRD